MNRDRCLRILLTLGLLGPEAASQAPTPPDHETAAQRIDAYMARLAGLGFAGGVFATRGDDVIVASAWGLADRGRGVPMTANAVMTTGSLTKQFTGAAILLLESAGALQLDDPIDRYLPGVPDDKGAITVGHLLTHTSGLVSALGSDTDLGATKEATRRAAWASELRSPPGTHHAYSNVGYSLLAMVIEAVSGKSYEQYLREALFEPAGMALTGNALVDHSEALMPCGYKGGKLTPTFVDQPMLADGPTWNLRGNGGVLSTVEDMLRWHRALTGDAIFTAAARAKLNAPLFGDAEQGYGYGWGHLLSRRDTRMVEHDGGNTVFSADYHRYVDEGVALFVQSSVSEFMAEHVIEAIDAIVFGHDYQLPPVARARPGAELDALAGVYALADGGALHVSRIGGHLVVRADDPRGRGLLAGSQKLPTPASARRAERWCEAISAFSRGDGEPLAAEAGSEQGAAALTRTLRELIEMCGALESATSSVCRAVDEQEVTQIRVQFEQESGYLALWTKGGALTRIGVDQAAPSGLRPLALFPTDNGFEGFDLRADAAIRVSFADEALQFLTLDAPSRVLARAQRVARR
ncbi:MAG: serine hydrolase [Planctomycetota bacterium]